MTGWSIYLLMVAVSTAARLPLAKLNRKICAHSDGGGWDSGSSYSYVPTLKPEESISYRDNGYYSRRPRGHALTWLLYPLCPVYWVLQVVLLLLYIVCRAEYYLNYGEISPLIERGRYE